MNPSNNSRITPPSSPNRQDIPRTPNTPRTPPVSPSRTVEERMPGTGRPTARNLFGANRREIDEGMGALRAPIYKRPRAIETNSENDELQIVKRPRSEANVPVPLELEKFLLLPLDMWKVLGNFMKSRAFVSFGLTCKILNNYISQKIFILTEFKQKQICEFENYTLKGKSEQSILLLRLLELRNPTDNFFILQVNTKTKLRNIINHFFASQNEFILNILLGQPVPNLSNEEKGDYLENVCLMCQSEPIKDNSIFIYFQARKILEYYLQHEEDRDLFVHALGIVFVGIEYSVTNRNEEEIANWLKLINKYFDKIKTVTDEDFFYFIQKLMEYLNYSSKEITYFNINKNGCLINKTQEVMLEQIQHAAISKDEAEMDNWLGLLGEFYKLGNLDLDYKIDFINQILESFNDLFKITDNQCKDKLVNFLKTALADFKMMGAYSMVSRFLIVNSLILDPTFSSKIKALALRK